MSSPNVVATLTIFSGRPDPATTLTDGEINTLQALLATLTNSAPPHTPPYLGYQGFTVDNLSGDSRLPDQVVAHCHVVAETTSSGTSYFLDSGNTVENYLLSLSDFVSYSALVAEERLRQGCN